jgi:hypothetical protein
MSDYRIDEHRVNGTDVIGSWLVAALSVVALVALVVPLCV